MRYSADNKTLKNTLLSSGLTLCLFLTGCANGPVESVDQENSRVRADRYDRAVSELSRAIEKNPQNARAYYERGLIYYEQGDYDQAWRDVRKAQSLGYDVPQEFLRLLTEASAGRI